MAAADAAGAAVISQMPVDPPPISAEAVAEPPPPFAADAVETFAEPPPVVADAVIAPPPIAADAFGAQPPAAAEDAEAAAELVLIQSVMDGTEEPLPSEILKIVESIEVLSSHADDQKPCDMVTGVKENEANHCSLVLPSSDSESYPKKQPEDTIHPSRHLLGEEQLAMIVYDNNSKESEEKVPTQPCPSSQQQISMDTDDLSDDSPTRNSNDDSDHSDGGYYYDRMNRFHDPRYRFLHRRERMMYKSLRIYDAWRGDYPFIPDLINPYNHMGYRDIEPWNRWPSPEPDHGKKRYNVGAGLSNPHWWTCFLNCILQCMVHTVPLVLKLREADHIDPCPRASIGFCCFCSLKLHADDSIRLSGRAFYPENFVNHLKSISPKFESGVQQDAQEFFSDLLEKLDEASVPPRSSLEEPSSTEEVGIAKKIFGGCLKSQLRCPECGRCSDKSEPFIDLSLEVTMMESLMDALQSFTKVELIEDFMCDGCKSRVNMEKHFEVEQAPEVLVIHLKRFTNTGGKISDKVKYPLELDINSFMSSSDDTTQKYDLYGVVVHHGMYGRGHYVCYIRSSVDDWYEFNDDKIRRSSEASVLDLSAYLLFYVKQGSSPWFSTLLEKEDNCPQDGSVSLAEQGTSEIALVNMKDEELTSSHEQDNSGYCFVGLAEEDGNGPSLLDFSQDIQQNGNVNTLSDEAHKLAVGCCLGGISGGTQELSCLTRSSDKNGHADGLLQLSHKYDKPLEKDDVSPRGSLDTNEMNPSTHGSSEVDPAATQGGGSPPKSEKTCSLLQLLHKYDEPWEEEDVSPRGSLDTNEMNPSTNVSSEVDPTIIGGVSPPKSENICSLHLLSHIYDDNIHCRHFSSQDETGGCSGAPSMGMCTSENETVVSKSNHEFGDSTDGASKGKCKQL
ncbi:unnamed protein product [Urochloa decumbens]|uniref:USP domain-containing protein n=1 Tax=Urochloa decumbens TaxID=240449 RepID=A0ABC8XXI0_9POAL